MKHNQKRWVAAAMSLLLTVSAAAPVSAAGPAVAVGDGRTPTCDEAYYATLDYYGNLTEGSVVKSYVLNGATSITDYGDYESIDNLTKISQEDSFEKMADFLALLEEKSENLKIDFTITISADASELPERIHKYF